MRFVYAVERRLSDGCWLWKEDLEQERMGLRHIQEILKLYRHRWGADNVRITIMIKED